MQILAQCGVVRQHEVIAIACAHLAAVPLMSTGAEDMCSSSAGGDAALSAPFSGLAAASMASSNGVAASSMANGGTGLPCCLSGVLPPAEARAAPAAASGCAWVAAARLRAGSFPVEERVESAVVAETWNAWQAWVATGVSGHELSNGRLWHHPP